MLSSGFANAPVSKFLLFAVIASSMVASLTDSKYLFYIQIQPHLWPYKQFWRLFSWQGCYTNSTELLFATMTLYHLRIIERLWGSNKFASFLVTVAPITSILAPLLLSCVLRPLSLARLNYLPAGPTPLVFALLAQYHAAIPHVYKYRVATSSSSSTSRNSGSGSPQPPSLMFSDKSTTYLIASQLALSQLPGSLLPAAVGWGAGMAWRNHLLPEKLVQWRLPWWFVGDAGRRDRQGFEGLRRRLEGEGRASGLQRPEGAEAGGETRRRGIGRAILDQFRGAF